MILQLSRSFQAAFVVVLLVACKWNLDGAGPWNLKQGDNPQCRAMTRHITTVSWVKRNRALILQLELSGRAQHGESNTETGVGPLWRNLYWWKVFSCQMGRLMAAKVCIQGKNSVFCLNRIQCSLSCSFWLLSLSFRLKASHDDLIL